MLYLEYYFYEELIYLLPTKRYTTNAKIISYHRRTYVTSVVARRYILFYIIIKTVDRCYRYSLHVYTVSSRIINYIMFDVAGFIVFRN